MREAILICRCYASLCEACMWEAILIHNQMGWMGRSRNLSAYLELRHMHRGLFRPEFGYYSYQATWSVHASLPFKFTWAIMLIYNAILCFKVSGQSFGQIGTHNSAQTLHF